MILWFMALRSIDALPHDAVITKRVNPSVDLNFPHFQIGISCQALIFQEQTGRKF